ncbi:cytoskeleton protein RodZ [Vibrio sp. 99-8-1]|uniref:cytoskeleton protein RodZ n=1 Tax=Vibrio sp. 99-8-1 TaxID=2607602 RepID=UPI0014934CCB|nr:cytoskeleton protein RodZ [Vibrio sp. 99-8-1]NOI67197.1 cytoskeleton protein RodZ [Vibrio sp. 99-8-1]
MSTDTENSNIVEEEVNQVLAGDLLRQEREKLGLSQKEIADRLRLRVSIIESIDNNNYDFDQVATFTRGYLRSYAKAVSLDEKEVLAALNHANEVQHAEQEMQSFSRKTKREKNDSRIMKLTWAIFAVIIGISSVWWYQNQQDTLTDAADGIELITEEATISEPSVELNATNSSDTIEQPVVEPEAVEAEQQTEAVDVEISQAPESDVQTNVDVENTPTEQPSMEAENTADAEAVVAEESAVSQPAPSEGSLTDVTMAFSADCWIQVKDASGATLATGVKKAGREFSVVGEAPFSFILGAPEGVKITIAGEAADLSGYTSGKVARFTLP